MLRVDSFATIQQPEKMVVSMEGVKGLFTLPNAPFSCTISSDIQVDIGTHFLCFTSSPESRNGFQRIFRNSCWNGNKNVRFFFMFVNENRLAT